MAIVTYEFREGQQASVDGKSVGSCPYLWSSPASLAWLAGFAAGGMSEARKASTGRGYSVRFNTVGGAAGVVTFDKSLSRATIDRVS